MFVWTFGRGFDNHLQEKKILRPSLMKLTKPLRSQCCILHAHDGFYWEKFLLEFSVSDKVSYPVFDLFSL
jgi:hypothetical protein